MSFCISLGTFNTFFKAKLPHAPHSMNCLRHVARYNVASLDPVHISYMLAHSLVVFSYSSPVSEKSLADQYNKRSTIVF